MMKKKANPGVERLKKVSAARKRRDEAKSNLRAQERKNRLTKLGLGIWSVGRVPRSMGEGMAKGLTLGLPKGAKVERKKKARSKKK